MAQSSGGGGTMQQAKKVGTWIAVAVGILTILGTLITGVSGIAGKLLPSSYKAEHATQHEAERAADSQAAETVTNTLARIEDTLKENTSKMDSVAVAVHSLDVKQASMTKEVEGIRRELTQLEDRRGGYSRPAAAAPPD